MKKLFLIPLLALSLASCDRQEKHPPHNTDTDTTYADDSAAAVDKFNAQKPQDQKLSDTIRELIIEDDSISDKGKNIDIVTVEGVVTLKGQVLSTEEKEAILDKLKHLQGVKKIDNKLEIDESGY